MIDYNQLTWTEEFVLLPSGGTAADAYDRLPADDAARAWRFVVASAGDGAFVAVRWIELEEITRRTGWNIGPLPLDQLRWLGSRPDYAPRGAPFHRLLSSLSLEDLLARLRPIPAVDEQTTTTAEARARRDANPGGRLPVTRGGQLVRLLTTEYLSTESPPPSVLAPQIEPAAPVLGAPAPERLPVPQILTSAPPPMPGESAAVVEARVINCWIEQPVRGERSVSAREVDPTRPLLAGRTYELRLDVDLPRGGATTSETIGEQTDRARELGLDEFTIALQLIVDDAVFICYGVAAGELVVPTGGGPSHNRVAFAFAPRQGATAGTLVVACSAFGQVFQELRVEVTITDDETRATAPLAEDAPPTSSSVKRRGRRTADIVHRGPAGAGLAERISLLVTRVDGAYKLSVIGAGRVGATINLAPETVNAMLKNVRATLKRIVQTEHDGAWIYCVDTTIPEEVHRRSLRALAVAGRQLFDDIFYHDQNDVAAQRLGDELARFSRERRLDITVAADRFPIPWTLVYPGEDTDNPDEELFWGFRHSIQYAPEFAAGTLDSFDTTIDAAGALPLAFVLDTRVISEDGDLASVAGHPAAVKALPDVTVQEVLTRDQLLGLLKNADAPPLLYFYTHANSVQPTESSTDGELAGVGASYVTVDGQRVTLQEMRAAARVGRQRFTHAPLLFLNACQGAEMDATQTTGLLTYFIALGARGAIGTEVDTPAVFAADFGQEFLARFTRGGAPLGRLMLELRREYLKRKHNVMGLVYALYASGELRVARHEKAADDRSSKE